MGYWLTTAEGGSFADPAEHNKDGSEMLWGDAPADAIDDGQEDLIQRLTAELGRKPEADEVNKVKLGTPRAPEIVKAIKVATEYFTADVGRAPTADEVAAGLRFSNAEIALEN